ncbi:DUF4249 family protein [Zobellia uliginosa]|uniref:DUF4249 family protein n=1 Tax=Zobellia uliginosa TaxID=143224 RepID=UPI0026E3C44F|nr:DUF4249 family protein [Zobellia uliginosa]MDO6518877.1 DUF4249 family protein [Zobellia uliginosa]
MSKYIQISFVLALLCSACQDPVDADELLNEEDRTYIVGYISPADTLLSIHVSTTTAAVGTPIDSNDPLADVEKFIIKDARVVISDEENNAVELTYNPERKNYQVAATAFDVIEGGTYFLQVSAKGKDFSSTCRIPKKIPTITEKITLGEKNEFYQDYILDIAFQDFANEKNHYIIGATAELREGEQVSYFPLDFELNSFLTDAIGDGETISRYATFSYGFPDEAVSVKITLQVTNVEEILYSNLRASFLNDYNDGNPFVEYSIAPNNIEGDGGIGVFAGYQLTEKVIEYELATTP